MLNPRAMAKVVIRRAGGDAVQEDRKMSYPKIVAYLVSWWWMMPPLIVRCFVVCYEVDAQVLLKRTTVRRPLTLLKNLC